MDEIKYKVYAKLDENGNILNIDGGVTIKNVDVETWSLIDEGTDALKYGGCQQHYLDMPLMTPDGIPRYKWDGTQALLRFDEEIENERKSIQWKSEVEARVRLLKQKLSDTDYQAIKFSEGWFTEGEFAPMKAYRQSLRDKINELENGGNPYMFSFGPGLTPTIVHNEEEVSE